MRQYDEATTKFMQDTSIPKDHESTKKQQLARQGVSFVKGLASGGVKTLPANVLKRAIGLAVISSENEKTATPSEFAPLSMWKSLNDKYGKNWWDWEPETIWQTLTNDFMGHPSDELKNLIQALQVICKTNLPFEDWSTFEKVGHAINSNNVAFDHVQLMDLDEVALTVKIIESIRHKIEWTHDVLAYIAASAKHCGVVYLPVDLFPLGCQEFLDKMGNNEDLKNEVIKVLKPTTDNALPDLNTDTALGVQMARLKEIRDYVAERI